MRIKATAFAFLAASVSAMADVKINDHFTFNGYAVASYGRYELKPIGGFSDNAQTALLGTSFDFKPVSGKVSAVYFNGEGEEHKLSLLDAYATVQTANGFSVTAGNFLSYMGYESFHPTNRDQITRPDNVFQRTYHTGARIDYAGVTSSSGLAIVDSIYSPNGPFRGDGEIKHNVGFEYFYSYTGIKNVTLWAGVAHETANDFINKKSVTFFDFWASYKVNAKVRVAAEYVHKGGGSFAAYSWLTFLNYSLSEKVSCTFRISGSKLNFNFNTLTDTIGTRSSSSFGPTTTYTISPSYNITKNVTIRAQYSHTNIPSRYYYIDNYYGVQTIFKF